MVFAILAAGEGSRLMTEGIGIPKPLIKLDGVPMIERLIRIFERCGASRILVVTNEQSLSVHSFLNTIQTAVPLELVVQTTPSSMHSFFALMPYLKEDRFCLTTVDTIFDEIEFKAYITHFKNLKCGGSMAVTNFIDDESPLYVNVDKDQYITGFYDAAPSTIQYISGGIYCLTAASLSTLAHCMKTGVSRMRNYQRQLVSDDYPLYAYPFGQIIDVDHATDLEKATQFIHSLS